MTTESTAPLTVDLATGLLAGVRQVLSPYRDARPSGARVELIVLHGISLPPGEFGGAWIDRLFCGDLPSNVHPYFASIAARRVSAHALIRRQGDLTQYVPFAARAWHAGESSYGGRSACNDFSIGIELEGTDHLPYTNAQYTTAAALIALLVQSYPTLSRDRVVGHSDVAPGRKTDPGPAFNWPLLRQLLRDVGEGVTAPCVGAVASGIAS